MYGLVPHNARRANLFAECSHCDAVIKLEGEYDPAIAKQVSDAWSVQVELEMLCEECIQAIAETGVV